jgi:hypothetical protein
MPAEEPEHRSADDSSSRRTSTILYQVDRVNRQCMYQKIQRVKRDGLNRLSGLNDGVYLVAK